MNKKGELNWVVVLIGLFLLLVVVGAVIAFTFPEVKKLLSDALSHMGV